MIKLLKFECLTRSERSSRLGVGHTHETFLGSICKPEHRNRTTPATQVLSEARLSARHGSCRWPVLVPLGVAMDWSEVRMIFGIEIGFLAANGLYTIHQHIAAHIDHYQSRLTNSGMLDATAEVDQPCLQRDSTSSRGWASKNKGSQVELVDQLELLPLPSWTCIAHLKSKKSWEIAAMAMPSL